MNTQAITFYVNEIKYVYTNIQAGFVFHLWDVQVLQSCDVLNDRLFFSSETSA